MNQQNQLTPEIALQLLDQATSPLMIGKLTRLDYVNVQASLDLLAAFVKAHEVKVGERKPVEVSAPTE